MTTADWHVHRPQLYSATQVRELDRRAIEDGGIPGYTLMRRAAQAAFDALRAHWPHARAVAVLCGPGNNGGDGYELARIACAAGLQVQVASVGGLPKRGDAVHALAAWVDAGGEVSGFDETFVRGPMAQADLQVDAIFGIGIDREVGGVALAAIEAINARASAQATLAIDLPSGLDADTGAVHGTAVRAAVTVSFIGRKLGVYTGAGPDHAGLREFADLGVDPGLLQQAPGVAELMQLEELAPALPRRARDAHKGRHGHVLIVGGDLGMAGAVLLAARGALRAGAGLVSVATRAAHALPLTAAQPEAMFHGIERADDLAPLLPRADVVAIGPGLGTREWGRTLLEVCLPAAAARVIDADALNLLAQDGCWPLPTGTVITPHPGEAGRLLGRRTGEVQAQRLQAACDLHALTGAVVVLKGAGSLVVDGHRRLLCPLGNPGMGAGGTGDVLTGVIAALIAQGLAPAAAAAVGVLGHARAGDVAAAAGERGLLPGDLIAQLRAVLNP